MQDSVQCGDFTRKQRWCEWEAAYEESLRRAAISMNEAELAAVSQHSHQPHVQHYPGSLGSLNWAPVLWQGKPNTPETANSFRFRIFSILANNIHHQQSQILKCEMPGFLGLITIFMLCIGQGWSSAQPRLLLRSLSKQSFIHCQSSCLECSLDPAQTGM